MSGCTHRWLSPGPLGALTCSACGSTVREMRRPAAYEGRDADRARGIRGEQSSVPEQSDETEERP